MEQTGMRPGLHRVPLVIEGVRRRYLAHVPVAPGDAPWPVVVLLHGAGATARWAMLETRLPEKADAAGFLAVFPEALPPRPGGPTNFLENPLSWDDGSGQWGHHDDLGFLGLVLDDLPGRFPVDSRRIYVTGFSNGAAFSFRLAERFCRRLAALGPVAGHCWAESPRLDRPVPTVYLIGTSDPLLPIAGGVVHTPWSQTMTKPPVHATWHKWAVALGLAPAEQLVRHEAAADLYRFGPGPSGVVMNCWTLTGHGHHWPGGRGQFDARYAGPNTAALNANDVLWDFFQRWDLDGVRK
jgi:polyhydroxybutyrate depolymerase